MGLMSNKIGREKLRPGDHIYTWRNGYSYSHHGIYVGDGKVIHFTRGPGLIIFSRNRSQRSNDRVVCCSIEDFLCDGELYRFEYGVSKFMFLMKRAGTCSCASSKPPEDVLYRASYLVEHGFGDYNLFHKNCEDFALYCKTSILKHSRSRRRGMSGQIRSITIAFVTVIFIPYQLLPSSFIVLALVDCGCYCFLRLTDDVGHSDNAVVAVDNLDNIWQDDEMVEKSTRWFLGAGQYLWYTIFAINIWYWTSESTILVWLKSFYVYILLQCFVSAHLRLHEFKSGKYSAYTIGSLGYLYWRWRSVSTILLWTRLVCLCCFLEYFVSHRPDHPRRSKLRTCVAKTRWALELWYWTPGITILQFIKLALLYIFLFIFVPGRLRRVLLMRRWAFFACFVIQSAALLFGPGLQ